MPTMAPLTKNSATAATVRHRRIVRRDAEERHHHRRDEHRHDRQRPHRELLRERRKDETARESADVGPDEDARSRRRREAEVRDDVRRPLDDEVERRDVEEMRSVTSTVMPRRPGEDVRDGQLHALSHGQAGDSLMPQTAQRLVDALEARRPASSASANARTPARRRTQSESESTSRWRRAGRPTAMCRPRAGAANRTADHGAERIAAGHQRDARSRRLVLENSAAIALVTASMPPMPDP